MNTAPRLWIFDLDDTLHDASHSIFPVMNQAMTQYIMDTLRMQESEAYALRQHYWRIYGATLKGLMRHHGVNPHHFLDKTHRFLDLPTMVRFTKGLRHSLLQLPGRKVIFTNAPIAYAERVLAILGIGDIFELIYSVESTKFHPKPHVRGFVNLLRAVGVTANQAIMVEDSLPALMTAKRMGLRTVLMHRRLFKPSYVDYRVQSVLALTRLFK